MLAVAAVATTAIGASAGEQLNEYFDLSQPVAETQAGAATQVGFLQDVACCSDACGCGDVCGCDGCGCDNGCCGTCCGDACGLGGNNWWDCGCVLPELLLGCFCPTPHCYDDFISPMTNPIFFEDPRTLTELRAIYFTHKVPLEAGGGRINLYAMQIRAALSDRLSIVAAKDGYLTSSHPIIDDGWADVSLGLKYNLFSDPRCGRLLSTGLSYELPVGTPRAAQGNGDGEFHLYLTGGRRIGCRGHWLSASGFRLPADDDAESTVWYWSNHFDTEVRDGIYAFTEFNWYHWIDSGANPALNGVEGLDAFNFGSTGVDGNDIVTGAFGLKLKPNRKTEIGLAWEFPLTDRRDVIDNRLTADLIMRY